MYYYNIATHRYPASVGGPGGGRIFDALAKGLAELGREVYYHLPAGSSIPYPQGFRIVSRPVLDVDIWHLRSDQPEWAREAESRGLPWVATCHTDLAVWTGDRGVAQPNWIYVSQALAETYGSRRFVRNGVDPAEFIFSEDKEDYLLFVAAANPLIKKKGLELAIDLARAAGRTLIVAGSGADPGIVNEVAALCRRGGAEYRGEVYGTQKALLFARARALLFPTQINEAFGQVIAEALVSGTPVISSANGACAELVTPEAGAVCRSREEYLRAIDGADRFSPEACRAKALRDFHYRRMAADYLREYESQIANTLPSANRPKAAVEAAAL